MKPITINEDLLKIYLEKIELKNKRNDNLTIHEAESMLIGAKQLFELIIKI